MQTRQDFSVSAMLRHLSELGSPVDLEAVHEESDLEISQVGSPSDARMFEMNDGRAGFIFQIYVLNRTSRKIYCEEIDLRFPWPDSCFGWLENPRHRPREVKYYEFPGGGTPHFPYDQVLNHLLISEEGAVLRPGVPYNGFLLAFGGYVQKHLKQWEQVDATLAIIGSEKEYTAQIMLRVERNPNAQRRGRTYSVMAGKTHPDQHQRIALSPILGSARMPTASHMVGNSRHSVS